MELQNLPWYGQLIVFLIIGGILFGAFYYFYYSPNLDVIADLDRQITDLDKEIQKGKDAYQKIDKIKEENDNKKKVLEKLKSVLPERKEISQILKKIQSIITSARLEMLKFAPQREKQKDIVIEWPIVINVNGNYHNLGSFFDQISRLKKIFTINKLNIKPLKQMTPDRTINAGFVATTYIYHERVVKRKGKKKKRRRKK